LETPLTEREIKQMRMSGMISENEIALKVGDLLVAENVLTRERRILQESVNENGKRILKG
jgi:hypothetical protein